MKENHLVGVAKDIQGAILVTEYLRKRLCWTNPSPKSGCVAQEQVMWRARDRGDFWFADIMICCNGEGADEPSEETIKTFIEVTRAFAAGRGILWA